MRAANTGPAEARRRMRAMRKRVFEHDVARWASSFLDALSGKPAGSAVGGLLTSDAGSGDAWPH